MNTYWIIYEFYYPNSYGEFYQWIAETDSNAKECGINSACFKFDGNIEDLKESLSERITNIKSERIYTIYKDENNVLLGKFLFGNRRKSTSWDDYLITDEGNIDYC